MGSESEVHACEECQKEHANNAVMQIIQFINLRAFDPRGTELREARGAIRGCRSEKVDARGPHRGGPIQWSQSEGARAEGTDLLGPSRHTHKQANEQKEGQSSRVPEWPSIGNAESQNRRAAPSTTGDGIPERLSEWAIHLPSATTTVNEGQNRR